MNIGLYVIGDEILSGKRQDKHLANVSSMLKDRGLQLSWVKILGDDLELLVNEFKKWTPYFGQPLKWLLPV